MNSEQVNTLIGLPYENGAFGPYSFNCWGLLYYVQRYYFKNTMPVAPIGNAEACVTMFNDQLRAGTWARLETPVHGSGALLRAAPEPHVGIYLDIDGGGILHAVEHLGVIWTPIHALKRAGYGRTIYYRLS